MQHSLSLTKFLDSLIGECAVLTGCLFRQSRLVLVSVVPDECVPNHESACGKCGSLAAGGGQL